MATEITLDSLRKEFGDVVAVDDVDATFDAGDFVTLVGPSGCGKTTTLRMIAGLETPTDGRVIFDGEDVTDEIPQRRPISIVFQNTALFPHMTCRENIGYGLKIEGVPKSERNERVEEAAALLQIADQLDKMPGELSGGQRQRVALGAAFVEDPEVLLLDEPMSDLDAKLKEELRVEIQQLHRNLDATMVYVTHDQNEAMTMSDRIALMDTGHIEQYSDPETLFDRPVSEYAATFVGTPTTNVLPYTVEGDRAVRGDDSVPLPADVTDDAVRIGVRPQFLDVGGGPVSVEIDVDVIEPLGVEYVVHATERVDGIEMDVVLDDVSGLAPGDTVRVGAALDDVYLFDTDGNVLAYGLDPESPPEVEQG